MRPLLAALTKEDKASLVSILVALGRIGDAQAANAVFPFLENDETASAACDSLLEILKQDSGALAGEVLERLAGLRTPTHR